MDLPKSKTIVFHIIRRLVLWKTNIFYYPQTIVFHQMVNDDLPLCNYLQAILARKKTIEKIFCLILGCTRPNNTIFCFVLNTKLYQKVPFAENQLREKYKVFCWTGEVYWPYEISPMNADYVDITQRTC